jgi:3-deoxy-manno-octulosonate cytidylyltransferase (CMP-KDO synthetase)
MSKTAILIPARYGSTRFEGKPLALLNGVPMIRRVYEAAVATGYDTYVLTDDMRIFNLFGPRQCWVDQEKEYANGTERCAGAITDSNFIKYIGHYDNIINVQGDMPDVTLEMIEKCIEQLSYNSDVSTVYTDMPKEMQDDPNSVKMIKAYPSKALWFGRGITGYGKWHLGVYGYKRHALVAYNNLKVTQEETIEQLEQLRWLKNGWQIGCSSVYYKGVEINAPEDVDVWHKINSQ